MILKIRIIFFYFLLLFININFKNLHSRDASCEMLFNKTTVSANSQTYRIIKPLQEQIRILLNDRSINPDTRSLVAKAIELIFVGSDFTHNLRYNELINVIFSLMRGLGPWLFNRVWPGALLLFSIF